MLNMKCVNQKNMKKYRLIFCFTVIFFSACSETTNKNEKLIPLVKFYPSGTIQMTGSLKNNLKNGKTTIYYENGVKKYEHYYLDDKLEGEYLSWYNNGNIHEKTFFKSGLLTDSSIYYYQNGNVKGAGIYLKNLRTGVWKWYYEDGSIRVESNYLNDLRNGNWTYFNTQGKIDSVETYESGKLEITNYN